MITDNSYQNVWATSLTRVEARRKRRKGVRVWQRNNKKKSGWKIDTFVILVFLYLIFSVSCLLWFGWKYYTLRQEVNRLSEIIVTIFEDKAAEQTMTLPEQKEPANNPLPAIEQPDTAVE